MNELAVTGAANDSVGPFAGMRLRGTRLIAQPAVRRALPALLMLLAVAAAGTLWLVLRAPEYRVVLPALADTDKAAVLAALKTGSIQAQVDPATGAVEVAANEVAAARILLAGQGLPKAAASGYDLLGTMPLGTSRAVETARLKQAQETELAASIMAIDGVENASVHLATGEVSVFIRDHAAPSAAVFVKLANGRVLSDAQVRAIGHLVASSIAGLATDQVSIVDQSGRLLSGDPASGLLGEGMRQLAYQARVETQYRQRVLALLTPMLGESNFSAEVSADLDFSENAVTHESYDKDGVIRSEQGSSATEAALPPARGIPGALSNTVPPAAQVGTAAAMPASVAAPATGPKNDSFARSFEVGKAVSVTRGAVGQLRRLSVAVVVRDTALGAPKGQPAQLAALTGLVRSAVGFDARRGDNVTIAGRPFAPASADAGAKWYEQPSLRSGGEALVALVGLAVLVLGIVRPLIKRLPAPLPAALLTDQREALNPSDLTIDYTDKLAATKRLVAADTARASVVMRQMIRVDAA